LQGSVFVLCAPLVPAGGLRWSAVVCGGLRRWCALVRSVVPRAPRRGTLIRNHIPGKCACPHLDPNLKLIGTASRTM
jgi:hypothetical protein